LEIIKQPTAIICLSPYSGGMELDSIKLAKKLSLYTKIVLIAKRDHFIALKQNEFVDLNDISLETIKFKSTLSLSIIINARKIIKKHNIKNVIFFGASELKSLYFSFLGLDVNLIIRHGTTKSTPKKDLFHRLIYSKVNYHISICKHIEKNVEYIIPFGKNTQSKLIYSSLKLHRPHYIKQDKLTLLHIGRITKTKGQMDAIRACKILIDNNIDFVFNIVGGFNKADKNEFMNFYNNCQYKNKINLIGFTDNIREYIQKSDIFLFPSYGEGLSNAFLEAISNNIVCLAYDNTSFPELKELGFYFELVQNKNIEDLQIKLLDKVSNLKRTKEKLSVNYTLAKELFSKEKEMENYLEVLK
jgi:glycosyltransferase involved in cell wall biosynthesis